MFLSHRRTTALAAAHAARRAKRAVGGAAAIAPAAAGAAAVTAGEQSFGDMAAAAAAAAAVTLPPAAPAGGVVPLTNPFEGTATAAAAAAAGASPLVAELAEVSSLDLRAAHADAHGCIRKLQEEAKAVTAEQSELRSEGAAPTRSATALAPSPETGAGRLFGGLRSALSRAADLIHR